MVDAAIRAGVCRTLHYTLLAVCLLLAAVAQGGEVVKIGVLANRPKPQTLTQWQPLADALQQSLPQYEFSLQAFTLAELERAVASRQLDFVLTNPGHYVLLNKRSGLSSALATMALDDNGVAVAAFGGVMFARADRVGIDKLVDLRGKKIAATDTGSLGGFRMQVYELHRAGIEVEDFNLLPVGMANEHVINAVLSGHADVGFVRTGVLEALVETGKLDWSQLKVINQQQLQGFSMRTSTRLYPEWPFAAMPQTEENLARHVAAILFLLEDNTNVTRALNIHGFGVPADYGPVVDLLRELRLPPFDVVPNFTLADVWFRYYRLILAVLLLLILIVLLVLKLLSTKRLLLRQQNALKTQKQQLQASESFLRTLINALPDLVWLKSAEGLYLACNNRFEQFFGAKERHIVGWSDYDFVPRSQAEHFRKHDEIAMQTGRCIVEEWVTFAEDGHKELLETTKVPMRDYDGRLIGILGIGHDITERKRYEEQLQLAASVFSHAREGILITHADGSIIDVNATFTEITGYSREDVVGKNPRLLRSGRHSETFYAAMWQALLETGAWSGEVWNRRKSGEVYAQLLTISAVKNIRNVTQHYVALFSDITPFKEYEAQLERIAHFDMLTGLPNRILLADRLRQAMHQVQRRGEKLAVVFLDLDGFKAVNDGYGHDIGDELLMRISSRMKQALRETDTLARLGGDEFVAILVNLSTFEVCQPLLERLLAAAAEPVIIKDIEVKVSASVGVSQYPQAFDIDADQLMRQADQAMYQAKLAGKNRYHLFDASQDGTARSHYENLERIGLALQQQELVLYFQPKINMRSGRVIGVEALLRWRHPDKGLLLPVVFLPVIDNHPLAVEVGEWVVDAALSQIEAWQAMGLDLNISVNVSARQLQQADFVERLRILLQRHPCYRPGCLEVEILESSALEDVAGVSRVILACRELGVRFALDDFGTGYSSLTYLKHLPVSQLKIDQSFVSGMLDDADDRAILQGVIGLAAAFKLEVIAEGVESRAHGEMLLQLGCELAQGHGIARPMPADALYQWLLQWGDHPVW